MARSFFISSTREAVLTADFRDIRQNHAFRAIIDSGNWSSMSIFGLALPLTKMHTWLLSPRPFYSITVLAVRKSGLAVKILYHPVWSKFLTPHRVAVRKIFCFMDIFS